MKNSESLARSIALLVVLSVFMVVALARLSAGAQGFEIHARMPEQGGWESANLKAEVGKPMHLLLTSDDVVHGFAIGKSDFPAVDIYPGEFTEVELTFDRPGTYTFYCTRWCGTNHWRMRGTIEVSGPGEEIQEQQIPLYMRLGLDIDEEHNADLIPDRKPSSTVGSELVKQLSPKYLSTQYYRTHTPAAVWNELRADSATISLNDEQVWDLVAAIWRSNTTEQTLEQGKRLYAENCAACHGELGDGKGVIVPSSGELVEDHIDEASVSSHELVTPVDFNDPLRMLGASPALLQGKILRGGMGTGMPYWGPIFSDMQTWALVDFLYTYQFHYKVSSDP